MVAAREGLTVGLIGHGAIGRVVAEALLCGAAGSAVLTAVLCQDVSRHSGAAAYDEHGVLFTDDPAVFFACAPAVVVEAAGQAALHDYATRALRRGTELLVSSIGAFADEAYFNEVLEHAEHCEARIGLVSGALPAVDWLSAANLRGAKRVAIVQSKPVESWRGTRAEELIDLDVLSEPSCFFEGNAREAATQFPNSSNITAMLALCTVGMDDTLVKLMADPIEERMATHIEYEGEAGSLCIEWRGVPSVLNPRTSADVPLTIVRMLRDRASTISYGA